MLVKSSSANDGDQNIDECFVNNRVTSAQNVRLKTIGQLPVAESD